MVWVFTCGSVCPCHASSIQAASIDQQQAARADSALTPLLPPPTVQGEYYACALSSIYTFGPTFRAEHSYTARHLAEFWMIEPELAFCDLHDDMQCAEDYVRFCCKWLLDNCKQVSCRRGWLMG